MGPQLVASLQRKLTVLSPHRGSTVDNKSVQGSCSLVSENANEQQPSTESKHPQNFSSLHFAEWQQSSGREDRRRCNRVCTICGYIYCIYSAVWGYLQCHIAGSWEICTVNSYHVVHVYQRCSETVPFNLVWSYPLKFQVWLQIKKIHQIKDDTHTNRHTLHTFSAHPHFLVGPRKKTKLGVCWHWQPFFCLSLSLC